MFSSSFVVILSVYEVFRNQKHQTENLSPLRGLDVVDADFDAFEWRTLTHVLFYKIVL